MKIGEAIKELRKNRGLSQQDLAEAAGITQTALSQIETGSRPGEQTLTNLSKALKVPEVMIHLLTYDRNDVPRAKRELYDKLFPVVRSLIKEIAGKEE